MAVDREFYVYTVYTVYRFGGRSAGPGPGERTDGRTYCADLGNVAFHCHFRKKKKESQAARQLSLIKYTELSSSICGNFVRLCLPVSHAAYSLCWPRQCGGAMGRELGSAGRFRQRFRSVLLNFFACSELQLQAAAIQLTILSSD